MELEFNFQNGTSGPMTLRVSGSVTVKHSKEFREELLKCLDKKNLAEISFADVESLDKTALQLIYLLKEEYKTAHKTIKFFAPKSEETADIIRRSGLFTVFES